MDAPLNTLSPAERYRRDPAFRNLVDVMRNCIHYAQYTPTELREAAILAATLEINLTIGRPWYAPLEDR